MLGAVGLAAVAATATACPGIRSERGYVDAATTTVATLSDAQPAWAGELVVDVSAAGMAASSLPEDALVDVVVLTNAGQATRPLALLEVDATVDGPSLLPAPDRDDLRPDEDDPIAQDLAAWYEAGTWTHQAAVSGYDQSTGATAIPLALPCTPDRACQQRVPFRVHLLEPAPEPVEVELEVRARVDWDLPHAEIAAEPPPEGAAVTLTVSGPAPVEPWATVPAVRSIDRGAEGVVPVTITYPESAEGAVVRFVTGAVQRGTRGDVHIDGWYQRGVHTAVGRGVFEVPLVAGFCADGICRLEGRIGDPRRPDTGPVRVAVDVRRGPSLDAEPLDGVDVLIG